MTKNLADDRPALNLLSGERLLALTPYSEAGKFQPTEHFVQFYESDGFLLDSVTKYLADGLRAGDNCVVIGTEAHRDALAGRLLGHGFDVVNDGLGERYFAFDAHETLSRFFVNEKVEQNLFDKTVGSIVSKVVMNGRPLRAFGEMVALLADAGNLEAALQLEQFWNNLRTKHDFALFCAYSLSNFSGDGSQALLHLCAEHSQVIPAESYNALPEAEDRLRAIVVLQQKARELESEIAERKNVEEALHSVMDELKKLLISEQLARAEAEMANRMKDEFLATVSHELRTPLNAIIGWTHMLRNGKLNSKSMDRAFETIDRNAKAQAQLVEDLLDVSRVITGKLQLVIGPVDVAAVINAAIDSVQPAATSKEIQIEVTLDPTIRHISGDANRLQQVVWNLLSNAIKFTPAQGRVNVSLKRKDAGVQISVADTGNGIDPAFVPFIFDRFRQADGGTTRRYGGLGLGLSIVRHLVELHGGMVEANSAGEGKGATFTITLPNSIPQPTELDRAPGQVNRSWHHASEKQTPLIIPSITDRRILLVDDDEDSLKMLAEVIACEGASVETANSAKKAIEILEWFQADVIVSDLAMPDDDGYTLIQMIRARETAEQKPAQAIALTALVRVEDRARALSAGFNMFLPKPVQPNELISAIANLTASVV
jgi:signal transduction histidine kinase/ActR/RegA family two-component response regulator